MDGELRKLQLLQADMAWEVKRICTKRELPYFMIAGTLLGAVRHQGFIPWDDDLDLGLLRPDYERFLEACKTDLDSRYFLQTWDTDPAYGLPFAKLRLNGTRYVEQNAAHVKAHDGIFIDIFPFDNIPNGEKKREKQNRATYLLKRLLLARNGYEVWQDGQKGKKAVYTALTAMSHLVPLHFLQRRLLAEMEQYNTVKTEQIVTFGGSYGYQKESIRREWVEECAELPFEQGTLSAPAQYGEYLSYFYGDYMTPPPEDQRADRHKIKRINFGAY